MSEEKHIDSSGGYTESVMDNDEIEHERTTVPGPRELNNPANDPGYINLDDSTTDPGQMNLDDSISETGSRKGDDPASDSKSEESACLTIETDLGESNDTSDGTTEDFCFVVLDEKTGTVKIQGENETPATQEATVKSSEPHGYNTDRSDMTYNQHARPSSTQGLMADVPFYFMGVCVLVTLIIMTGIPFTPVEEDQYQSQNEFFLSVSGSERIHQFSICSHPTQRATECWPFILANGRFSRDQPTFVIGDEETQEDGREQGIQGLRPGGDSGADSQINTCNLDNWLNMVFIQLDRNPYLLREVTRLADEGIELFLNLHQSYRLWKEGHLSEAKMQLCQSRDMRSSEAKRILGILENELSHCFVSANGQIDYQQVILQDQRNNGSEWQDIAEAVSAYERREGQSMEFTRPPVFLPILLVNQPSFQEDNHRINPDLYFTGVRYYLAAVTYTVHTGNASLIQHLMSRVFVPNGEFSDGLPQGTWWLYTNDNDGQLVEFTEPPCGYSMSMAHYVRVFEPDHADASVHGRQLEHVRGEQPDHVQGEQSERVQEEQPEYVQGGQPEHVQGGQREHVQGEQPAREQEEQPEHVQGGQLERAQGGQPEHIQGGQLEHVQGGQLERLQEEQLECVQGGQPEHVQGGQLEHVQGEQPAREQEEQPKHIQGGQLERAQGGQPEHIQGGQLERVQGGQLEHVQREQPERVQERQPEHVQGGQSEHVQGGQSEHVQGGQVEHVQGVQPEHEQG